MTTALATGAVVPLTGYVCANGQLTAAIAGFVPVALCYGAVFILTVELPDIEEDRISGKKTFVAMYGQRRALQLILLFSVVGTLVNCALHISGTSVIDTNFAVLALLTLLPVGAAGYGLARGAGDKKKVVGSVQAIMGALVVYVLLVDLYLYAFL